MKLTPTQRRALAALYLLQRESADKRSRAAISFKARGMYVSFPYPVQTMVVLMDLHLVEPESACALELVVTKKCRCSCDRWGITESGAALVRSWNIVTLKDEAT